MNEALFRKLLDRAHVPVPGDSSFLSSLAERNSAIEVAVIHHHRLAFYYWLLWTTQKWTRSLPTEDLGPDLVTVDWHDDVGGKCDCVFDELSQLVERLEVDNVENTACLEDAVRRRRTTENNVAAYSFLGLRSLNDGHIFPAQYLNAIGNVYVLYKQYGKQTRKMVDQFGLTHKIVYCTSTRDLVRKLGHGAPRPTYFDLDVDYFFNEGEEHTHGAEVMVPENEIRSLLDLQSGLLSHIAPRPLRGMTIALEPTYCGGLTGCFRAMSIISETLFDGSLLGDEVDWRRSP